MKINDDVRRVLGNVTIDGNALTMPQMDRKLYVTTNKVLEALGGKWNRGAKSHLFDEDPSDALERALTAGEITTAKDLGYFPTPPELAERVVRAAGIKNGDRVLEPSAGEGALVWPCAKLGAEVFAMELDEKRAFGLLQAMGPFGPAFVECGDFLNPMPGGTFDLIVKRAPQSFDAVVMNPPFGKRQELAHVEHAFKFLKPKGRLAAIMPCSVEFRNDRRGQAFREWIYAHGGLIDPLPADSFKSVGTGVNTVLVTVEA